MSTVEHRLKSWRTLLETGGPWWLMEHAPRIVRELEAELGNRPNPQEIDRG